MRILTVCLGNICRSPAAAAAIKEAAVDAGYEVEVDSAGTGSWHIGQPPHPESVAAAARVGLRVDGRARRVTPSDFDRFDVILAMDRSNLRELTAMAPNKSSQAKLRLFRTYDPDSDEDEIPDPWGGPTEGYEETIRIVRAAARGLVEDLFLRAQAW
ncbi:MAG TPA: low molecular weight protein-tyrosine-phosphatase [Acidimicrobiia bacterium]|nr:low molecular weight protein-tyrosine-phosphatase [Acidimicrobiia bacterium]